MKVRFKNEVFILREHASNIPGILPAVEISEKGYWYTMPIATPIMDYIKDKKIDEIIAGVIQLSETLAL